MTLVEIIKNEPVVSSLTIAEGMKLKHRAIMVLVDKYKSRLEGHGTFAFQMRKSGGRQTRFTWLNESQTVFLITLMRNSDIVVEFKDQLTKEFFKQRKLLASLLAQQQNLDWLDIRQQGKISRRQETETIKQFIQYAKDQGSQKPEFYYANLSKMENKALFIVEQEFKNLRDCLSGQQLQIVATADIAVAKALQAGMDANLPYQEIYQLAKQRMEAFADIVGKTLVPMNQLNMVDQVTLTN